MSVCDHTFCSNSKDLPTFSICYHTHSIVPPLTVPLSLATLCYCIYFVAGLPLDVFHGGVDHIQLQHGGDHGQHEHDGVHVLCEGDDGGRRNDLRRVKMTN